MYDNKDAVTTSDISGILHVVWEQAFMLFPKRFIYFYSSLIYSDREFLSTYHAAFRTGMTFSIEVQLHVHFVTGNLKMEQ